VALIEEFVNTSCAAYDREELGSPLQAEGWLVQRGLLPFGTTLTADEHASVLAVREALRAHLLGHNGYSVPDDAVRVLDRALAAAGLLVRLSAPDELQVSPVASGVAGALGHILSGMVRAIADGSWVQLKACRDQTCRWAFFDRSRNQSRVWCTMAECGNRSKTRSYRRRLSLARQT
jgi:predicted RNA-binding Zn ribbon-like protein